LETLHRIYDSCITQRQLETAPTFTPTKHVLQTIKRIWQVEGIHGLPAISAPTFFPTDSRNKDTWWEKRAGESTSVKAPQDEQSEDDSAETEYAWDSSDEQGEGDTKKTAYMWDSIDEEDRTDTMNSLDQSDRWVIWKSKDKWSVSLKNAGFHQLLHIQQDIKNRTGATSVKPFNKRKDRSPRTTISVLRLLDTYNTSVRHSPKYIHSHTTGAGASFTQS
jgi:hypothetical protein